MSGMPDCNHGIWPISEYRTNDGSLDGTSGTKYTSASTAFGRARRSFCRYLPPISRAISVENGLCRPDAERPVYSGHFHHRR